MPSLLNDVVSDDWAPCLLPDHRFAQSTPRKLIHSALQILHLYFDDREAAMVTFPHAPLHSTDRGARPLSSFRLACRRRPLPQAAEHLTHGKNQVGPSGESPAMSSEERSGNAMLPAATRLRERVVSGSVLGNLLGLTNAGNPQAYHNLDAREHVERGVPSWVGNLKSAYSRRWSRQHGGAPPNTGHGRERS